MGHRETKTTFAVDELEAGSRIEGFRRFLFVVDFAAAVRSRRSLVLGAIRSHKCDVSTGNCTSSYVAAFGCRPKISKLETFSSLNNLLLTT